jgi:hypothetical protein
MGARDSSGSIRPRPRQMRPTAVLSLALLLALGGCVGEGPPAQTSTPAAPSPAPSTEPTPSPELSPTETPGPDLGAVPAQIRDRPWAFQAVDGSIIGGPALDRLRVLTPSRTTTPEADWRTTVEWLVLVVDGAALTTTWRTDSGPNTLRLRDLATGAPRWETETMLTLLSGARLGGAVLLSGWDRSWDDSGISMLDPATGALSLVVPGQPGSGDEDHAASRRVLTSPSGRTIVSELCIFYGGDCLVETIDPQTWATRTVGRPSILVRYVTDELVIGTPDLPTRLVALSLATGERAWRRTDLEVQWGYQRSDGRVVQSYIDHANGWLWTVAIIDPASGVAEVVYAGEPSFEIWPTLSTDRYVVMSAERPDFTEVGEWGTSSLLDLATGQLLVDVLTVRLAS